MSQNCPEALPPKFLAELKQLYVTHARRNLRLTRELFQVLGLLASQYIPALPFKGPTLAQLAYRDITQRQFVDLDILVPRLSLLRVKELMVEAGYGLEHLFTEKQERIHLKRTCEFTFVHPHRAMLDVHWRFAADYLGVELEPKEVFARRQSVTIDNRKVDTLCYDDLLLGCVRHRGRCGRGCLRRAGASRAGQTRGRCR